MPEPTPTGLTDNSAGALAYVTFVPAIVFLAMPPYNASPYVRFHSWQSIFLFIAAVVIWVVVAIISAVGVFLVPVLMGMLHLLISLALFLVWILCVIQALNGKLFKLPVIGALAAKQAGL